MTTDELKKELKTKERTINDLLRFIVTRNDHNPNYALLLGSGCSVTSGIKSGGQLISEWREEIYQNLSDDFDDYNAEKAIEYLSKNQGAWYNKINEYSSLFEKKYDLPRQRRMFVEMEVAAKTPSIGYAYLINLVNKLYFNTLFTTNFDDLLNEAFYQYSDVRPMLCAHDSSINSITITSKRPKIIKLHGDYLFDDIKSTLRETESLEENIRNKFIEFAKDFGLIVIGYGGHDRSIMDVLNFLLKHEDYYKHGIYWCIRKDDTIGEDLRKLLWKDKVYFVEIDGFDELFAHLHQKINKDKLPIDTNFISNKSQEIIQQFINNDFLKKSKSKIIQDDIKNLSLQNERNNIYELIKQMQSEKDFGDERFSNKEVTTLIKLANYEKQNQYDEMITLINDNLDNTNNKFLKIELLKQGIKANKGLGKDLEAIRMSDLIIAIDPKNTSHYQARFNLEQLFEKKLEWIDTAINFDEYNANLYSEKASLLEERYDFILADTEEYTEILNLLDKSLIINPSIDNDAWDLKFQFILKHNKGQDTKNCELSNIIELLSKQNPYDISLLEMQYDLLKNDQDREKFLLEINVAKDKYLHENKLSYELIRLKVLDAINDKKRIKEHLSTLSTNSLYRQNNLFLTAKAVSMLKKFDELETAIGLLEESLKLKKNNNTIRMLVEFYLLNNELEKAEKLYTKYKARFQKSERLLIEKDFFDQKADYINAYLCLEELAELNEHKKDKYISPLSFYLLQQEEYEKTKNLLNEFLTKRNFSPILESEIINYEFACIKSNPSYKINKKRLEGIMQITKYELTKAAIFVLEEKYNDAFEHINIALDEDMGRKYEFKKWPVFSAIKDDSRFKKLFVKEGVNQINHKEYQTA